MRMPEAGKLLRVFIGETDRWQGQPLYEAIVHLARKEGMAGATVLKGCMGFGAKSHLHTAKLLRLLSRWWTVRRRSTPSFPSWMRWFRTG